MTEEDTVPDTYALMLTNKPGGEATLDEFAEERFDFWEDSRDRAREVDKILQKRYPKSGCRVYGVTHHAGPPVGSAERRRILSGFRRSE
jgi:hypothetical protein